MPSEAHVTVIGHLGADAELEYTPGGVPRLRFRVAVDDGSEKQPHTTWYAATLLGARAESWSEWGLTGRAAVIWRHVLSGAPWVQPAKRVSGPAGMTGVEPALREQAHSEHREARRGMRRASRQKIVSSTGCAVSFSSTRLGTPRRR